MRRMPIRCRISFTRKGCPSRAYAVLDGVSAAYPPASGRLHTCYSPVRRSPAVSIATDPAAPRLACVKPVASVHPEPGSNSSLFFIFSDFIFRFVIVGAPGVLYRTRLSDRRFAVSNRCFPQFRMTRRYYCSSVVFTFGGF